MKLTRSQNFAVWAATGFGIGRIPFAPGTWGSLAALLPVWAVGRIPGLPLQAAVVVAICLLGVPLVNAALTRLGRGDDPGCVVWDEIAGMLITFFAIPTTGVVGMLLGFGLFRLFDITKPPPVRQLERFPRGWGVMADDCAAGVYANLALRGILSVAPAAWLEF